MSPSEFNSGVCIERLGNRWRYGWRRPVRVETETASTDVIVSGTVERIDPTWATSDASWHAVTADGCEGDGRTRKAAVTAAALAWQAQQHGNDAEAARSSA